MLVTNRSIKKAATDSTSATAPTNLFNPYQRENEDEYTAI